jgi:hypothetical protein
MLIIIRAHTGPGRAPNPTTLGRDVLFTWIDSYPRNMLASMGIAYSFRGYHTYQSACPGREPWIEYVIHIDESEYDLVKIALGNVRIFFSDVDALNDITDVDFRRKIRMPVDGTEGWEENLSDPPKKITLIKHFK